jgi:hypothetical protein
LQRDKRSCRQLPRIVTGVQPGRGEIGRHGEGIASKNRKVSI